MENVVFQTPPASPTSHYDHIPNTLSSYLNFSDPTNPFCLNHGDGPAITLVLNLLTIKNYETWSQAMHRAQLVNNKLGFLTGSIPKPTDDSNPLLEPWKCCNNMIVSWIHNSISPSIKSSIAFVDDAKEIWVDLQDLFSL